MRQDQAGRGHRPEVHDIPEANLTADERVDPGGQAKRLAERSEHRVLPEEAEEDEDREHREGDDIRRNRGVDEEADPHPDCGKEGAGQEQAEVPGEEMRHMHRADERQHEGMQGGGRNQGDEDAEDAVRRSCIVPWTRSPEKLVIDRAGARRVRKNTPAARALTNSGDSEPGLPWTSCRRRTNTPLVSRHQQARTSQARGVVNAWSKSRRQIDQTMFNGRSQDRRSSHPGHGGRHLANRRSWPPAKRR